MSIKDDSQCVDDFLMKKGSCQAEERIAVVVAVAGESSELSDMTSAS